MTLKLAQDSTQEELEKLNWDQVGTSYVSSFVTKERLGQSRTSWGLNSLPEERTHVPRSNDFSIQAAETKWAVYSSKNMVLTFFEGRLVHNLQVGFNPNRFFLLNYLVLHVSAYLGGTGSL